MPLRQAMYSATALLTPARAGQAVRYLAGLPSGGNVHEAARGVLDFTRPVALMRHILSNVDS